jgi:hypothetical protein
VVLEGHQNLMGANRRLGNLVLSHSNDQPGHRSRLIISESGCEQMPRIEIYEGSQKIADVGLPEKKFSTGSVGYWATQKLEINGKRYQCQFQLVEIGSKQKKE